MLNAKLIHAAIAATFALAAPQVFADSWLEQQLAITDGYSVPNANARVEGRQGFPSAGDLSWLEQQISISDGYSPSSVGHEGVYIGAKFEPSSSDSFMEHGRRISDGTPE